MLEDNSDPLFRFGSDIGCLSVLVSETQDDQVASGAGDFKIKWKNLIDGRDLTIVGHEAPILSIGLDPLGEMLISSSCDGTFRVWSLQDGTELHNGRHWTRSSDIGYAKCPASVIIEPVDGAQFALLCEEQIKIINRDEFTIFHEIDYKNAQCISWSDEGTFLAVGNKEGLVHIYNAASWMLGMCI